MNKVERQKLRNNEATHIKRFCVNRNITTLTHFTRVENLSSILENGLLGREQLDSQGGSFYFNDPHRYDEQRGGICLNLSFPNYRMFWKIRQKTEEVAHSQWVVLLLDVDVLWEFDCAFCQENAASNTVHGIPLEDRKSLDALRSLFCEEFHDGTRVISRDSLAIRENYPTNPQAEILVFDRIPSRYINTIVFYRYFAQEQWKSACPATYPQNLFEKSFDSVSHQVNGSDVNHSFSSLRIAFIIQSQSTKPTKPRKCALNNPS